MSSINPVSRPIQQLRKQIRELQQEKADSDLRYENEIQLLTKQIDSTRNLEQSAVQNTQEKELKRKIHELEQKIADSDLRHENEIRRLAEEVAILKDGQKTHSNQIKTLQEDVAELKKQLAPIFQQSADLKTILDKLLSIQHSLPENEKNALGDIVKFFQASETAKANRNSESIWQELTCKMMMEEKKKKSPVVLAECKELGLFHQTFVSFGSIALLCSRLRLTGKFQVLEQFKYSDLLKSMQNLEKLLKNVDVSAILGSLFSWCPFGASVGLVLGGIIDVAKENLPSAIGFLKNKEEQSQIARETQEAQDNTRKMLTLSSFEEVLDRLGFMIVAAYQHQIRKLTDKGIHDFAEVLFKKIIHVINHDHSIISINHQQKDEICQKLFDALKTTNSPKFPEDKRLISTTVRLCFRFGEIFTAPIVVIDGILYESATTKKNYGIRYGFEREIEFYQPMNHQHQIESKYEFGCRLLDGDEIDRDEQLAKRVMHCLSEQEHFAPAKMVLRYHFHECATNIVDPWRVEDDAQLYLTKKSKEGNKHADWLLGLLYLHQSDPGERLRSVHFLFDAEAKGFLRSMMFLHDAAAKGQKNACFVLGELFCEYGEDLPPLPWCKALYRYKQLEESWWLPGSGSLVDHIQILGELALLAKETADMYLSLPQEIVKMVMIDRTRKGWFEKAAKLGHERAKLVLEGVKKIDPKGEMTFLEAYELWKEKQPNVEENDEDEVKRHSNC